MNLLVRASVPILALLIVACSSAKLETRDVKVDANYSGGPVENVLVLSLMPDDLFESRAIMERAFAAEMRNAGVDATAGYTRFDSIDAILADPDAFQQELQRTGSASVLYLDPVKLDTDYDPGEYAARRSAYRALGLDSSASINLISDIARDASASKVVMNVGLCVPGSEDDIFNSTYDINAPGNYETEAAREYSAQFAQAVTEDLRKYSLVE